MRRKYDSYFCYDSGYYQFFVYFRGSLRYHFHSSASFKILKICLSIPLPRRAKNRLLNRQVKFPIQHPTCLCKTTVLQPSSFLQSTIGPILILGNVAIDGNLKTFQGHDLKTMHAAEAPKLNFLCLPRATQIHTLAI